MNMLACTNHRLAQRGHDCATDSFPLVLGRHEHVDEHHSVELLAERPVSGYHTMDLGYETGQLWPGDHGGRCRNPAFADGDAKRRLSPGRVDCYQEGSKRFKVIRTFSA
jgi:hypothetical protein